MIRRNSLSRGFVEKNQDIFADDEILYHPKHYYFEICWEVVNRVGGIYTVLRTKADQMLSELKNKYFMVGPYYQDKVVQEVEFCAPPILINSVIQILSKHGIKIYFGRWLIDITGVAPYVILVDVGSAAYKLDEWKGKLWNHSNIGIPYEDREANDALIFGFTASWFIELFEQNIKNPIYHQKEKIDMSISSTSNSLNNNITNNHLNINDIKYIVAHYHEWQAGLGVLYMRINKVNVATIFTTHATLLGRYLCASGKTDFYNNMDKYNLDYEAGQRNIYHRYCIERVSAHCAHVLTTVSEITALEVKHLLKREPDVITPNGLSIKRFEVAHEFQIQHSMYKEKIHEFVKGHFYGHYDFNLNKTLYFFSAGRNEFSNKGVDIFIESLARLNYMMQVSNNLDKDVTVVVFLIFPTFTNNYNFESLKGQQVAKSTKATVDEILKNVSARLYDACLRHQSPTDIKLLHSDDIVKLKKSILLSHRNELPPIVTHNIINDHKDKILNTLRRVKLFNNGYDRVKVIYHPEFLSSTNAIFNIDYIDFVRGCHLGVFPSYYEPWGYTPAECTIVGVPSVTTNLSGFGCFMQKYVKNLKSYGLYIVDRRFKSCEESIDQLANYMLDFCKLSRKQRIVLRNRNQRLSDILDWRTLGIYYRKARCKALIRKYPEIDSDEDYSYTSMDQSMDIYSPIWSGNSTPVNSDNDQDSIQSDEERETMCNNE